MSTLPVVRDRDECWGLLRPVRVNPSTVRWTWSCRAGCFTGRVAADYESARRSALGHVLEAAVADALDVLERAVWTLEREQRERLQALVTLTLAPDRAVKPLPKPEPVTAPAPAPCPLCATNTTAEVGALHTHAIGAWNGPSKTRLIESLRAEQDSLCLHCRTPMLHGTASNTLGVNTTVEHLWPKAYGGPNAEWNVSLAHQSCNAKRGTRMSPEVMRVLKVRLPKGVMGPMVEHARLHFGVLLDKGTGRWQTVPRRVSGRVAS